ncbi:MAG: hypothetical protein JO089_03890 [Alphaproteobacteria bacterium]|nr:hypothetical protein [Alphaproteobacteria bacterium]
MPSQPGAKLLLQAGDGATPEHFTTLGGVMLTHLALSNHVLADDTLQSGVWRSVAGATGPRAVSISAEGRFTDSAAERAARAQAFAGSVNNYRVAFPNGDTLTGPFVVAAYGRAAAVEGVETYVLTLESAGAVTYVTA